MHEEGKYNWKTVFQSYQLFMRIMVFDFFSRSFNTEEYHYDPNKTKEPVFRKKTKRKAWPPCLSHSTMEVYAFIQVLMTYLLPFNISLLDIRLMVRILEMVSRLVRWCIRCKRDRRLKLRY